MAALDQTGAATGRLAEGAARLWGRVRRLLELQLIAPDVGQVALELCCVAMQLPLKPARHGAARRTYLGLRDRCEQAAELLLAALPEQADDLLVDQACRMLRDVPSRQPALAETRLLADAVNLDDFGISGLIQHAMQYARSGADAGLAALADALRKRSEYGYWEARLKDSFHFEPVRQLARRRLESARHAVDALLAELREDQPT